MYPEIDGLDHPLMQLIISLLNDAGRKQYNKFIIDDVENIDAALSAGVNVTEIFFYGDHATRHEEFLQRVMQTSKIYPIRPRTCKKIFGAEKQSRVFAIADIPEPQQLTNINGDIAVLDGLMMMGNIGAIMRSALAFNMGGIAILNLDYSMLFDRRLIRASKGYLFKLPTVCIADQTFFNYCKTENIKIANCSAHATQTIISLTHSSERLAWVLGAEKTGVSTLTEQLADYSVKIPFNPAVESLNVSVAAAIIFYNRYQA